MKLGTKGKDVHELGKGGDSVPPGKYHVFIREVDDSFSKSDSNVIVEFEVLAGTIPDQRGRAKQCWFKYEATDPKDWQVDQLSRFFWAAGVLGDDEEKEIDPKEAVGRTLIVELVEEEWQKKDANGNPYGPINKTVRVGRGCFWPVGDKEIDDVPVNETFLKEQASASPASDAPAERPKEVAQTTPAKSVFDGL